MSQEFSLKIEDEFVSALKASSEKEKEAKLRQLIALAMYGQGILPVGKARKLAGMTLWEFEDLLARTRTVRDYSETDLKEDLVFGRNQ